MSDRVLASPPLDHLKHLLDGTGIAQHAVHAVVAREHGYCVDDNARGLILAATLSRRGLEPAFAQELHARTAAFVQHAWNDDRRQFRNFMSYDRRWLEEAGSEDSHGRAVWALGVVCRDQARTDVRRWARELLERAAPTLAGFTSPRALAFGLLGLVAGSDAFERPEVSDLRDRLAGRLCGHLRDNRAAGWTWFETSLTYDNARLPQALLAAGERDAGLDTLGWLCREQTAEAGHFRPIGSNGFWHRGGARAQFDQQPIEAAATVAACALAARQSGDAKWLAEAARALAWFHGHNDTGQAVAVLGTGGCRDGLHPDRVNANQGAESTLAWLQAELDMADAEQVAPAAFMQPAHLQVRLPARSDF